MTPTEAHADLMLSLLVERFATPVPEWHPVVTETLEEIRALRLVHDEQESA